MQVLKYGSFNIPAEHFIPLIKNFRQVGTLLVYAQALKQKNYEKIIFCLKLYVNQLNLVIEKKMK